MQVTEVGGAKLHPTLLGRVSWAHLCLQCTANGAESLVDWPGEEWVQGAGRGGEHLPEISLLETGYFAQRRNGGPEFYKAS